MTHDDQQRQTAALEQQRIDVDQRADLDRWTRELGISADELAKVIEITGNRASDVVDYVRKQGSPGTTA